VQPGQSHHLLGSLRRAARDLANDRNIRDREGALDQVVVSAVQIVPGADAGSIMLQQQGRIRPRNPTDPAVGELDQLQSDLQEGPCISIIEDPPEHGVVVAHDLAGDDSRRWPAFSPKAVECGYRAMLCTQLTTDGGMRAALNLYAGAPDVFDTEAQLLAGLFGVQTALLLFGADEAAHLQRALGSRDVIGQAKGILMERFTVDDNEAFQMLVSSSQDTNMKLVDVARWLTAQAIERRSRRGPQPDPDSRG
jgi:hypothetical protein